MMTLGDKPLFSLSVWDYSRRVYGQLNSLNLLAMSFSLVIGQVAYVLMPGLLGLLIDQVFILKLWSVTYLMLFPALWLIATVALCISRFFSSYLMQDVRKVSKRLAFSHIVYSPTSTYIMRSPGEVESVCQELSFNTRYLFAESLPFFVRMSISCIIGVVLLGGASLELVWLFLFWAVLFFPFSYFSAKRSVRHVGASLVGTAEVSSGMVEVVENHELISAFGTEAYEKERYGHLLSREQQLYHRAQSAINSTDLLQKVLLVSLPIGAGVILVWCDHFSAMMPGIVAAVFSLMLVLTGQLGDFGKGILACFEVIERMRSALAKLAIDPKDPIAQPQHRGELTSWDIKFKDVYFGYEPSNSVFRGVSLGIAQGEKVGIVGASGVGKTTLLRLIRGYCSAHSGCVTIGGHPTTEIDPCYLSEHISEVSQSIPLFHRSIRENITYGAANIDDRKLQSVIQQAQLQEVIARLPEGLESVVGVRGQRLSGGERARIAIARALFRNTKIIILDEATASIDSELEFALYQCVRGSLSTKTVIAISHRFSTLRSMDRILFVSREGTIAEGSHDDLLQANSEYQAMWEYQTTYAPLS